MRDLEIYLATGRQKASGHYIIYWLSSTTDYRIMGACLGLGNQPCVSLCIKFALYRDMFLSGEDLKPVIREYKNRWEFSKCWKGQGKTESCFPTGIKWRKIAQREQNSHTHCIAL